MDQLVLDRDIRDQSKIVPRNFLEKKDSVDILKEYKGQWKRAWLLDSGELSCTSLDMFDSEAACEASIKEIELEVQAHAAKGCVICSHHDGFNPNPFWHYLSQRKDKNCLCSCEVFVRKIAISCFPIPIGGE